MAHLKNLLGVTAKEWECIQHRLEVPDALAEVLDQYDEADVCHIADLLWAGRWDDAVGQDREIAEAVLADAVEGSTYAAAVSQDDGRTYSAACKALIGAWSKVKAFLGRDLERPLLE